MQGTSSWAEGTLHCAREAMAVLITSALMGASSSLVCTSLPSVSTMMATEKLREEQQLPFLITSRKT